MHDRPDKEHEIKKRLKIGRDEKGFNYYLVLGGVRIELDELDLKFLNSKMDELLYMD